jgi:hypothetical protein
MPGRWGDVEWPILIQRAGFTVSYRALDGLEWESADRYRASVADVETRQRAAVDYDRHTQSWVRRVHIAQEIVQEGFEAAGRSMTVVGGEQLGSSIGKRVSRTEAF